MVNQFSGQGDPDEKLAQVQNYKELQSARRAAKKDSISSIEKLISRVHDKDPLLGMNNISK